MEEKKPNELSDKDLEQAAGGTSRRDIASDPSARKRAADKLAAQDLAADKPDRGDVRDSRIDNK